MANDAQFLVWEVTRACNLRCRYCGSRAGNPRQAELSTQECMRLVEEIANIGVKRLSLMGGEPLIRKDLPLILEGLVQRGIRTDIVTNGTYLTPKLTGQFRKLGVYGITFSIDGTPEVHDTLRNSEGQFHQVAQALAMAQEQGIPVGVITHINIHNFEYLDEMFDLFCRWAVDGWQIQLSSPMHSEIEKDIVISSTQLLQFHDWAVEKQALGTLHLYLAHNVGYFHPLDGALRSGHRAPQAWQGCLAGKGNLGITSDGQVTGCMSLPDTFTEASVRDRSLIEIWNDSELFRCYRQPHEVGPQCADCDKKTACGGGCLSFSLATTGTPNNTPLCWYRRTHKAHRTSTRT